LTSFLIWLIATLIGLTWRVRIVGTITYEPNRKRPSGIIYSFWHAHLLIISFVFRNRGVTALVSGSRDGIIAAKVATRWKHSIIVGSSSRGGLDALRKCVRVLEEHHSIGITPDGPRGPKQRAKAGVAQMAIMAQAPVVALSVTADRYWQLRSWDGFTIPKPFARVQIIVSPPLSPPAKESDKNAVETFRTAIEREMLIEHPLA